MAKREDFGFPSKDGRTKIHAVKWLPDDGDFRAILQITHGMVEYIDRYEDFAEFLCRHGFAVVGHDHVGHGDSVVSIDDWGFVGLHPSEIWVSDMHRLRKGCERVGKPIFMLGHSMGSYLLRKYLSQHGEGLAGAVIMGTGYMPAKTVKSAMAIAKAQSRLIGSRHRSPLLQKLSYGAPYKKFDTTGKDPENSWLSKNVDNVKAYYEDPKCTFVFTVNAYMGLFEAVLDSCDEAAMQATPDTLPLLLVSGADDPVGDLGEGVKTVTELLKKNGCEDVTMKLYENDRHEILNETDRLTVYHDILNWLTQKLEKL